jgi:hypothetical protein
VGEGVEGSGLEGAKHSLQAEIARAAGHPDNLSNGKPVENVKSMPYLEKILI